MMLHLIFGIPFSLEILKFVLGKKWAGEKDTPLYFALFIPFIWLYPVITQLDSLARALMDKNQTNSYLSFKLVNTL